MARQAAGREYPNNLGIPDASDLTRPASGLPWGLVGGLWKGVVRVWSARQDSTPHGLLEGPFLEFPMSLTLRSTSMAAAGLAATLIASTASATIVAGWTIPAAFPTGTGNIPTGQSYSPPSVGSAPAGLANMGVQTAGSLLTGFHSSAATQWTSPVGNGPQNVWGDGGGDSSKKISR